VIDISVIVPTCRRPAQLVEAVRSALDERSVEVEVLIRDDSPDRSAETCARDLHDARVSYAAHEPPTGGFPAKVRNAAWPSARGRYVHFLDDDDRVAPGAYRAMADALDEHPKAGVVFGRVAAFGEDPALVARERQFFERAARRALRARDRRLFLVAELLFKDTLLVNSSCMIRRECIAGLGGYDETVNLFEDVEFFARAISRYGGTFVDRPVIERRVQASLVHVPEAALQGALTYRKMQRGWRDAHGAAAMLWLRLLAAALR
jgi:GT2 family glycosyltransferase